MPYDIYMYGSITIFRVSPIFRSSFQCRSQFLNRAINRAQQ